MMENDESAVSFDNIAYQSGQFGFFQKRLFLINTLIQSACVSVLLYSCTCMPEVDENDPCAEDSGPTFVLSNNGFHLHHHDNENNSKFSNTTVESTNLTTAALNIVEATTLTLNLLYQNLTTFKPSLSKTGSSFPGINDVSTQAPGKTGDSSVDSILDLVTTSVPAVNVTAEYLTRSLSRVTLSDTSSLDTSLPKEKLVEWDWQNVTGSKRDISDERLTKTGDDFVSGLSDIDLSRSGPSHVHPGRRDRENWTLISAIFQSSDNSSFLDFGNFTFSVDKITTTLRTSLENTTSSQECDKSFFVFGTALRRTQILESLSLSQLAQLTSYAQTVGLILGAAIGSMIADIYGRRKILYISLASMLVLHLLVALSISWLMFIFLRVVAVGCAGATLVVSFVIVIEFLGPDWRDACTCSCFWALGAIFMSLETLVTLHWRWLALLSGGICLPLIATFFTTMESLRWLQCQHRFTEAEGGFREVMSVNSATVPDIMVLLDQSRGCIVNNMHQKKFTFFDLFHSLDSTKWTITLVYTCIISSCVYFCLLWRGMRITGLLYFDGFLPFIIDLPLTWSVIVVNRCLGRRWCLFLYAVASGFALLSVLILHITGNVAYMPSLVTGLALFGKIGVTASMSLIFLVAIETYPTVTRCMGLAVAVASASGGSMLSNAFVFLEQYHYTVPFMVYGAMMSSVGVAGLLFPETIRKPLKNVQQCRHRKIPLMEGARLVGRPPNLWDAV